MDGFSPGDGKKGALKARNIMKKGARLSSECINQKKGASNELGISLMTSMCTARYYTTILEIALALSLEVKLELGT